MQHSIDAAANSNVQAVVIVLGSNADSIAKEIDKKNAHIVRNSEWEEGMASSVRNGLSTLQQILPSTGAVIFMVCDQPFVSASLVNDLIDTQKETGKPIVTSDYGEAVGPPALFCKPLFNELMRLKGDAGAKKIIQQHGDEVATVSFTKGKIDIDTNEDYEALAGS